MKLDVPYYSQFEDVSDPYWMPRACGFCCIKMVLDYYSISAGSIVELAQEAEQNGGYGTSGLVHDYVVNFFTSKGLSSHREEKMEDAAGIANIQEQIQKGNPVIVSIVKKILGQTKFHQVVFTGFEEENGTLKGFYFNDPENLYKEASKDKFVVLADFLNDWRRMAIFVSK